LRQFERFADYSPDTALAPQYLYLLMMLAFHVLKCWTRNSESGATMQPLNRVGLVELQFFGAGLRTMDRQTRKVPVMDVD
jgi:hypothetical protein